MLFTLALCLGNSTHIALNNSPLSAPNSVTARANVESLMSDSNVLVTAKQSNSIAAAEVTTNVLSKNVPSKAVQQLSQSAEQTSRLLRVAYHPDSVRLGNASRYSPPDFNLYHDSSEKKEAFYEYLLPMIHKANQEVTQERAWLSSMGDLLLAGVPLSENQIQALGRVEKRYDLGSLSRGTIDSVDQSLVATARRVGVLLKRVDVVPASLIVAQAAKESGWGTSRFATQGNNFFGIWCFYEGCGLTPLQRTEGFNHEVATFESVEQGVRYYVRTINTHNAYKDLRALRSDARRSDEQSPGELLANGLLRYSERGLAYVQEVQSMIRHNNLQRFTRVYSA